MTVCAGRVGAYVDLAPTLGKLVRETPAVVLVEVEKVSRDNNAVILKKVRDLKGTGPAEPIRHQIAGAGLAMPPTVLEWAVPGARGVAFIAPLTTLVCTGPTWYQVTAPAEGWWKPGAARPELPLAYCGTVSRLADAIEQMLAGKDAIITTLAHGADEIGASFDIALNRTSLPGMVKLQRMRANLRMPGWVISVQAKPHYMVGLGPVAPQDVPALIQKLESKDASERAEAAEDLRWLGLAAHPARSALELLLKDEQPGVRVAAAAAILRTTMNEGKIKDQSGGDLSSYPRGALEVLDKALADPDPIIRRKAARAVGLSGPAARSLVAGLIKRVAESDELIRLAAVQAISALGPDAVDAREAMEKLLDEPAWMIPAADALGRMGPAARPAMKKLAAMVSSKLTPVQWAGVRAMAQIGGPDAAPAVEFMIVQLKSFSEVDGYNMMVYLVLLGPDAKAAAAAVEAARPKNRALRMAALWSFDPENRFPWLENDRVMSFFRDADWQRFVFDAVYQETGDRFRPAARALARKIMEGSAGEIPSWGYRVLAQFPDEVLDAFRKGLVHPELVMRQRATVALGYMGAAAREAEADVRRALAGASEREQKLMRWCLKQIMPPEGRRSAG